MAPTSAPTLPNGPGGRPVIDLDGILVGVTSDDIEVPSGDLARVAIRVDPEISSAYGVGEFIDLEATWLAPLNDGLTLRLDKRLGDALREEGWDLSAGRTVLSPENVSSWVGADVFDADGEMIGELIGTEAIEGRLHHLVVRLTSDIVARSGYGLGQDLHIGADRVLRGDDDAVFLSARLSDVLPVMPVSAESFAQ